ncbi:MULTISPECIES: HNH endonuclease [unclassified Pseudomonas]|uniref:HNH endonuclease n=1 Tax=Pseudomonas TaxID=286 RepID=UPI000482B18A|nr:MULTISPECIES: HNH endonuclease [Pseudomonas]MBB3269653.1 intracellular multiplication protein IcmJ [Pseudomonas sp. OG7]MDI3368791.1 HNH endonuclease [Pseudomonas sp. V104_10]SNB59453.1 intracellular multiplication protein IcmJ [Pseudomonas sp. URIL14HWK12:I8]SNS30855.1 intracellular multiplication protein IcmJ [Pseudomonas sp. LAMO17WK12:I8]SNX99956.1 intracellular multiplication protein IcmJ [Pseudomonas sp. LAMO17WK12:I12]
MSETNSAQGGAFTVPTLASGYVSRTANQPVFGVRRPLWRSDDDQRKLWRDEHSKVRTSVWQRDNYTCRFCGFKSAKYQELHALDGNAENCTKENLITACNLCRQVHHLGACAMNGTGFFVAVQELTQTEINNIARCIYVNELLGDVAVNEKLTSLLAAFRFRGSDTLKEIFGGEVITVLGVAETLASKTLVSDEEYERRAEWLAPLRLFPTKSAFKDGQLDYYAANNRALFLPDNWSALTGQLLKNFA